MPAISLPVARLLLAFLLTLAVFPAVAASPAGGPENPEADALTKTLIERRLSRDDLANFHRVEVTVVDGVATLRGTARTRQARDALLSEVAKVSGVMAVQDKIEVEPKP